MGFTIADAGRMVTAADMLSTVGLATGFMFNEDEGKADDGRLGRLSRSSLEDAIEDDPSSMVRDEVKGFGTGGVDSTSSSRF